MVNGKSHPGYPYLHNRYHPMGDPFSPETKGAIVNGGIYPPPTGNHVQNGFLNDPGNKAVFGPAMMRSDHIDYTSKLHFEYADEKKAPLSQSYAEPRSDAPPQHTNDDEPRYVAMLEPFTPGPGQPKTTDTLQNASPPPPQPRTDPVPQQKLDYNNIPVFTSPSMPQPTHVLNQPQQSQSEDLVKDPNKRYSVVIGGLKDCSTKKCSAANNGCSNNECSVVNNGCSVNECSAANNGCGCPGVSLTGSNTRTLSATVKITSDTISTNYDTMQGKLSSVPRQNGTASMPGYTFNNLSS